ncbi:MAG: MerR family transcriptional regulator [Oscillospiraceae bacterium]|jgi:effector-binding domain-containing protein
MLKIGEFSKLSHVSVRMLRHYDEIGLLHPQRVDPITGYRLYGEEQLFTAGKINVYRGMGFGLTAIAGLLHEADPQKLRAMLERQQESLREQSEEMSQMLHRIKLAIAQLGEESTMANYDVTIKEIAPRYVASVRDILESYNYEGRLWHYMMKETADQNLTPANPCLAFGIFHDAEYKERDVDVEIQMTVEGNYHDTEHVRFKTEPAVCVASAIHYGSYETISDASAAVAAWVEKNGYQMCGVMFNVYHVSPHETQNPDELVTEVCIPVKRRDSAE